MDLFLFLLVQKKGVQLNKPAEQLPTLSQSFEQLMIEVWRPPLTTPLVFATIYNFYYPISASQIKN